MDIIIAHRGLTNGPSKEDENKPKQIVENIISYPKVINEIDVWINDQIFLGHNEPTYEVNLEFLQNYSNNLILHIKFINNNSINALDNLKQILNCCHTFCHDDDEFTITSKHWVWSHPKNGLKENCIIVMPEKFLNLESDKDLKLLRKTKWVCTDYPLKMIELVN